MAYKSIIALIATVLAIILIIQNMEIMETRILFVKIWMPRAFILFIVFTLGVIVGLLGSLAFEEAAKSEDVHDA